MKNQKTHKLLLASLVLFIIFTACYEFEFVNQPYQVDPNSSFVVGVSINVTSNGTGEIYMGILMPIGWAIDDTVEYINITASDTGLLIHSEDYSLEMSAIDPPQENYYWWVGTCFESADEYDNYVCNLLISNDNQTGTFFLDYILADDFIGLNYCIRSDDHIIIVGEPTGILPEGITFTNQEGIDNFQLNHPACTGIAGDVTVTGADIFNLNGLDSLVFIGGNLTIENSNGMISLVGLESLESIGGTFSIKYNNILSQILGLNSLTSIGGDFCIKENGLFSGILQPMNLQSIGHNLEIHDNPDLESLSGLENLNQVEGSINITGNENLTSLAGLDNILSGSIKNLTIINNYGLSDCSIKSLCNYLLSPGGTVTIEYNYTGCNNTEQIIDLCSCPCLAEGILFNTQSQIDSFPINYSICIEIEGDVTIEGSDINNLNGLQALTAFGGRLLILGTDSLTNLSGLDNVHSIGESLRIGSYGIGNAALNSLSGLENLTSIGGGLRISEAFSLTSLLGLSNLNHLNGNVEFILNPVLTNLSGLDKLDTIAGALYIYKNVALTQLSGLNNLKLIGENLFIGNNYSLQNLQGLENLAAIDGDFEVTQNDELLDFTGLEGLASIGGLLDIKNNGSLTSLMGLNNVTEIGEGFFISNNESLENLTGLESLTSIEDNVDQGGSWINENASLINLEGLESVTVIKGGLRLNRNPSLTSLNGLNNVDSISDYLWLWENVSLANLSALNNVTTIGGGLWITDNTSLANLSGLENVSSIGKYLGIGRNAALTDLTALSGVNSIGKDMWIEENPVLTDLTGLENIEAESITELYIHGNPQLAECDVKSICDYLAISGAIVEIYDNAEGCNNTDEVEESCNMSVSEQGTINNFLISPNPCSGATHLRISNIKQQRIKLEVFTMSGVMIKELLNEEMAPGTHEMEIDLSDLPAGVYYCVLKTNNGKQTTKLIKL